jgi:Ferritin-like domain
VVAVARRSVLIGGSVAVGLLVAGCTSDGPAGPAPTSPAPPDPLLAELDDEHTLIAAYDATIARYPALRARLGAVRDDHAAHAAALMTALGPAAPASPTSSPPASPSTADPSGATPSGATPSGATPSGATPSGATLSGAGGTVGAAVAALRAAERAAAAARGTIALTAPPDRARLLAGISASEASHVAVLT